MVVCCAFLLSCRTLAETVELLEKQVQCSICLEIYRDPKALACLHAYCRECIQRLLVQQQRDQQVECPQCRSVVAVAGNDPSSLRTVFFINGLIDVYKIMKKAESNEIACENCSEARAISFCRTCSMFICTNCTDAHKKMKAFEGHERVPISEMKEGALVRLPPKNPPTSTCKKHDGELKLYCFQCEQLICRDCTLVDHTGHRYDFCVKEVACTSRKNIRSSLVPLRDTHEKVSTAIVRLESSKKEIRDQKVKIDATIRQSFEELRARLSTILTKCEQVLLQQAEEVVRRKVDALDRQQEDLQLALAILDSLVGFVERSAENASDEEFISMKQQMTNRIQQVSREYQDVKLSPNEVADTYVAVPPPTSLDELCMKTFVADGPGLKSAIVNQESKFTLCKHDTHSRPFSVPQHVSAELKSLADNSVLQLTVVRQTATASTYELSYTPTTRGCHQLTVRVNNTDIRTLQVFVQHPPTQLGSPVRVIKGVRPMYIAFGDKGELIVTEHWNKKCTVLDAKGQKVLTIKSKMFEGKNPTGIATDGEGNVYVASEDKVQKFNRRGEVIKSVGKKGRSAGEFDWPYGVRYHNHQVYVCDSNNGRVQVFDSNLNFVQSFGTRGDAPGQLKEPVDIDFDCQANIYVLDCEEHRVLVFRENGQYWHEFGQNELGLPQGLCVHDNYVYITDCKEGCCHVSMFCTSGEFVNSFGRGQGELCQPHGIAVDKHGFVFVCDSSNNCIQVF